MLMLINADDDQVDYKHLPINISCIEFQVNVNRIIVVPAGNVVNSVCCAEVIITHIRQHTRYNKYRCQEPKYTNTLSIYVIVRIRF